MSNCYISLQEVTIIIKTPTTITSCNELGRLEALITHLSRRVHKASFENLEDKLNTEGGEKKYEYSNLENVFEYSNRIRILVDILIIKGLFPKEIHVHI